MCLVVYGEEYERKKPSVFISYNWESDKTAQKLEKRIKKYAVVKRDKTSLNPWDNLPDFMKSIRNQDFVVIIISDSYLKSDNCMYEVMQLMKDANWNEKVMFIVEEDVNGIYDTNTQIEEYINYWEKRAHDFEKTAKKHELSTMPEQITYLNITSDIKNHVGEFMSTVKSTSNPEMKEAIKEVVKKLGMHLKEI